MKGAQHWRNAAEEIDVLTCIRVRGILTYDYCVINKFSGPVLANYDTIQNGQTREVFLQRQNISAFFPGRTKKKIHTKNSPVLQ